MSNENIVTIVGFVTCIVVSVLSIVLLVKHTARNNSGLNNNVYNTEQMKELLDKYFATDAIETKGILEHPSTLENGEYRIFRPKKFKTSFMPPELISRLGDAASYLFDVKTFCEASSKTTESIVEYVNVVKRFVRSETFTSLTTLEKKYITIRIEEQLCKIIVKYIVCASNRLCESDVAIILNALDLD